MAIPFVDLQAQYRAHKREIDAAMQQVIDTSTFVLGPEVAAFEEAFASFCSVSHCVGLNSGTSALALLLQAHGIGPGDEVITVANTFFATAQAISEIGATPILVDCEEETALINPAAIEAAITPRTKAIIPVHLYGQVADMDAILAIARPRRILVLEDACQAHGATYRGKRAGSLADGAAFSFYPGKNLGAYGEAGAVTTNDPGIAQAVRMLREHGSNVKYHHDRIGWNERMDGLQGAVLRTKLPHLDRWNAARRRHAETYRRFLPNGVQTICEHGKGQTVYHLFVVRLPERDHVQKHLHNRGIANIIHYPVPIHLQKAYASQGWKRGDFPISEKLSAEILSLPMYPELSEEQIRIVCDALREAME